MKYFYTLNMYSYVLYNNYKGLLFELIIVSPHNRVDSQNHEILKHLSVTTKG